ncbi:MAG: hypothetical protein JSR65_04920 [Proteobacteria bacterium]|nr:hypothetical protein [Pseudomonadota bacterium]
MKTLVVQSYRTRDVAPWLNDCLRTVREWAALRGYTHEFLDDRFFDYSPAWVRDRCGAQVLPVTDIARLYLLREKLRGEWDRVVWIDADVLVFDPDRFVLDEAAPYALCFEQTFSFQPDFGMHIGEAINNAVMFFVGSHPLIDFWICAAEETLRASEPDRIAATQVGTRFLSALGNAMPIRTMRNVGLFVPPLIRDIAAGGGVALDRWAERLRQPIAAANLCRSMQDREFSGATVGAAEMQKAVNRLLQTRGGVVNDRVGTSQACPFHNVVRFA